MCLTWSHRIAILFAAVIYFKAGRVIWERREQLEGFLNPFNENPFAGIITTEINVTYEASRSNPDGLSRSPDDNDVHRGQPDAFDPYTVNVEVGERPKETSGSKPDIFRVRSLTRTAAMNESMNPGAWLYARVAFLFFLGMLIIWVSCPFSVASPVCSARGI